MDFQALSRRELQYLCKRNKIRANMTNAVMAEALQRQDLVDGINYEMAPIPILVPAPTVTTRLAARMSVSKPGRVILRRRQRTVTPRALDQEPKGEDASKLLQAKLTVETCEDDNLDEDEEWALNNDDSAEEIDSTDESDLVPGGILQELDNEMDTGPDLAALNELFEDLKGISLNMLRATYKEFIDKQVLCSSVSSSCTA